MPITYKDGDLIPCPECGGKLETKDTYEGDAYRVFCTECDYRKGPYEYPQ